MELLTLPESDKALLEALKEDDQNAFTSIYNAYSTRLYAVALQSLKSPEAAREIVQEIFVSFWVHRKTLVIRQSIKQYLLGAVRYKVFDFIDKQVVRDRYKHVVMQTSQVAASTSQEALEFEELNVAIHHQIETLPETTRHIFVMSRIDGLSNNEIAQQFRLSSKAVEYHITKAIKNLRLHLKHVLVFMLLLKNLF